MTLVNKMDEENTELTKNWIATSAGNIQNNYVRAHKEDVLYIPFDGSGNIIQNTSSAYTQLAKMETELSIFSKSATFSTIDGNRKRKEINNDFETRLCFERDRDRIVHSDEFRRLADKTQVFLNAGDHQRTRATHSFEVAQIATSLATSLRLNPVLANAIALGHDWGHGPGGHAAEEAFSKYVEGGFNHATFGADLLEKNHNLCDVTIDGIRNHSWSLNTPKTCEGEIVAWADRIAYVCHDYEDAIRKQLLSKNAIPENKALSEFLTFNKSKQISLFINDLVNSTIKNEVISMSHEMGDILCEFRLFNHEHIYNTKDSKAQNVYIINMIDSLVEFYIYNFNSMLVNDLYFKKLKTPPTPSKGLSLYSSFQKAILVVK